MSDGFEKFIRGMHALLLAAALLLIGLACALLWHLDRDARELEPTITDVRRTVLIVSGSATSLEKTLALERQAAQSQIDSATAAEKQLAAAGAQAQKLLADTDQSLNCTDDHAPLPCGLLPELTATISLQNEHMLGIEDQAEKNLADLDASEQQLAPAIANFNRGAAALADQLPPILANVRDTTAQTVTIGQNAADTTHQLDLTAQDIRSFVHRETTPVRGAWNTIKGFLMEFAGPAAQVATAAK